MSLLVSGKAGLGQAGTAAKCRWCSCAALGRCGRPGFEFPQWIYEIAQMTRPQPCMDTCKSAAKDALGKLAAMFLYAT